MLSQNHEVVLVTGASRGIGRATALALAEAGYLVYASMRHLQETATTGQTSLNILQLDVTDEASMTAAVQEIEAKHGAIDVLVNNAGISELGPVEEVPLERVRLEFETNVFGLIRLSQLVLPGMRRNGRGRIVNISSMGGEFSTPFSGIYHASKYAVEAISDAMRFEVQPFGVDVIVIQPGVVFSALGEKTVEAIRSQTVRTDNPYAARLGRFLNFLEQNNNETDGTVLTSEAVAQVIVEAVQAAQPETRYKIGEEAGRLAATAAQAIRPRVGCGVS